MFQGNVLTSGLRFATRTLHLSFVPVIPGGKPPPKAVAIAAAFAIYNSKPKYICGGLLYSKQLIIKKRF